MDEEGWRVTLVAEAKRAQRPAARRRAAAQREGICRAAGLQALGPAAGSSVRTLKGPAGGSCWHAEALLRLSLERRLCF